MKEIYHWFRKSGSFDCTLEKINCIKKAGIRSVIMTTVSGTNIKKEIPNIIDTVVAAKADVFAFARYCPNKVKKKILGFLRKSTGNYWIFAIKNSKNTKRRA